MQKLDISTLLTRIQWNVILREIGANDAMIPLRNSGVKLYRLFASDDALFQIYKDMFKNGDDLVGFFSDKFMLKNLQSQQLNHLWKRGN